MFYVSVWLRGCSNALYFNCDYLTYNTQYTDLLLWCNGELVSIILISDIEYFSVFDKSVVESEV